eukprot:6182203-Pleurochrysis_carterae.AAC.1
MPAPPPPQGRSGWRTSRALTRHPCSLPPLRGCGSDRVASCTNSLACGQPALCGPLRRGSGRRGCSGGEAPLPPRGRALSRPVARRGCRRARASPG